MPGRTLKRTLILLPGKLSARLSIRLTSAWVESSTNLHARGRLTRMSVKVMARVWAHSGCAGTELLTVLALADWADDDGWCWPSLPKLAKKTRVTVSQLCKTLTAIEQRTGEIYRERSTGRRNRRTRYPVTVTENSVADNSVAGNSVVENSVIHAPKTVSPTRGAYIRHRTINKSNGASAPNSPILKTNPKKKKLLRPPPDAATLAAFEAFY